MLRSASASPPPEAFPSRLGVSSGDTRALTVEAMSAREPGSSSAPTADGTTTSTSTCARGPASPSGAGAHPAGEARAPRHAFPLVGARRSAASISCARPSARAGWARSTRPSNLQIGRIVAIKVLHAKQRKKKEAVKRFHQEARTAGAIGHPNICEVYDLGTLEDGCPYLVMERLVGVTLADRIRPGEVLPIDEVARRR